MKNLYWKLYYWFYYKLEDWFGYETMECRTCHRCVHADKMAFETVADEGIVCTEECQKCCDKANAELDKYIDEQNTKKCTNCHAIVHVSELNNYGECGICSPSF